MSEELSNSFLWIPIFSGFFAFIMAFGIGANDFANSFATTIGSQTLSLRTAVVMASVCEFVGAILMGARVSETVKDKIVDINQFEDDPEVLMFIMFCALVSASCWLIIASYLGMPVSTTHAIVSAVAGAGLAAQGREAISWSVIGEIVLSWILTPVISGVLSFASFYAARKYILQRQNSVFLAYSSLPFLTFFVFFIHTFFIIYEGSPHFELQNTPAGTAVGVAFAIGIGSAVASYFIGRKYILPDISSYNKPYETPDRNSVSLKAKDEKEESTVGHSSPSHTLRTDFNDDPQPFWLPAGFKLELPDEDIYEKSLADLTVHDIHDNTEKFHPGAEKMFSYMQIITAIFDSFAHGANDVANSAGPLAAAIEIYRHGSINTETDIDVWILVIGAFGMVAGLALYGSKVIASIGIKLAKVTPSRGFFIELISALVVVVSSQLHLPVSTTYCQVGSTVGVGVANSLNSVHWKLMFDVLMSWITTIVFSSFFAGLLFSFGYYTPSYM